MPAEIAAQVAIYWARDSEYGRVTSMWAVGLQRVVQGESRWSLISTESRRRWVKIFVARGKTAAWPKITVPKPRGDRERRGPAFSRREAGPMGPRGRSLGAKRSVRHACPFCFYGGVACGSLRACHCACLSAIPPSFVPSLSIPLCPLVSAQIPSETLFAAAETSHAQCTEH